MKLVSVTLSNFKCIVDLPTLSFRPLTILVGPNSSGKTSLIQWLLALCQTARSRSSDIPLLTSGPLVDLGPFADYVSFHQRSRRLRFGTTLRYDQVPDYLSELVLTGQDVDPPPENGEVSTSVTLGYNQRRRRLYLLEARFDFPIASAERAQVTVERSSAGRYPLTARFRDTTWRCKNSSPMNCFSAQPTFSDEAEYRANTGWSRLLFWLWTLGNGVLGNIIHLGPLRQEPRRYYVSTGEAPTDVGARGQDAASILWLERHLPKAERTELLPWLDRWMRELGMADGTQLAPIRGVGYRLELRDPHLEAWANVADVGFGVSQALPIIVQASYSSTDSLSLIEQPEIHLHPRAQAVMGDLLIEASQAKTIVVETHSAHLLARIRRRIAEGHIDPTHVAIYNFSVSPEGTEVQEVKLNQLGQYTGAGWPPGFFQEDVEEARMHYQAVLEHESEGEC
jgi:hypothetical protein